MDAVQFGQDIVEKQDWAFACLVGDEISLSEFVGDDCEALLTAGSEGREVATVDQELDFIAVRSHEGDTAPELLGSSFFEDLEICRLNLLETPVRRYGFVAGRLYDEARVVSDA